MRKHRHIQRCSRPPSRRPLTALILTDVNAKTVPEFIATQLGQTLPMLQKPGAASMLLTLPVIAIALIAQKYLVAGLNAGAVKG
jgi:multiple sugar transport system permease protein